jgi:hypothetical protein
VESVTGPISKIISKDGLDGLYRRLDKDGRVVFAMGKIDQADMWQVGQNASRTRSLWIRSPPVSLRRHPLRPHRFPVRRQRHRLGPDRAALDGSAAHQHLHPGGPGAVTLLRRLGNHSHKNRLYRALREMGRVIRTVTLLRYLSDPGLREQITAVTNKTQAFHGYSEWLMIRGKSATTIPSTRSG